MRVSYNRNVGFVMDTDLTLLLDVKLIGFSGPRLSGHAELTYSRLMQSIELPRLAFDEQHECRV